MRISKKQLRRIIRESRFKTEIQGSGRDEGGYPVLTVGDLKRAISGLPDDARIGNGSHEFGLKDMSAVEVRSDMLRVPDNTYGDDWVSSDAYNADEGTGEPTIVVIIS